MSKQTLVNLEVNDIVRYMYSKEPSTLFIVKGRSGLWLRIIRIDDEFDSRWVNEASCSFVGKASGSFQFSKNKSAPKVADTCTFSLTNQETPKIEPVVHLGGPNKPIVTAEKQKENV